MRTIRISGELTAASLKAFRRDLQLAAGHDLTVDIDSNGGSAICGLAMYSDLKHWPGTTTARVHHAGSAATLPMCACQRVVMGPSSTLLTHAPTLRACRDLDLDVGDLQRAVDDVRTTTSMIAGIYAEKSGGSIESWLDKLRSEIRWSGQGAVNVHLADQVEGGALAVAARSIEDTGLNAYPTPAAAQWRAWQREAQAAARVH